MLQKFERKLVLDKVLKLKIFKAYQFNRKRKPFYKLILLKKII